MHCKDGSIGFCMCFKCRSCSIVQVNRLVGEKTAVDNRDIYILQLPRHIHTTTSCKMPAKPPIYKSEQLEKYLQRIHYGDSTDPDPEHSRLSQLQQHVQKEPLNASRNCNVAICARSHGAIQRCTTRSTTASRCIRSRSSRS